MKPRFFVSRNIVTELRSKSTVSIRRACRSRDLDDREADRPITNLAARFVETINLTRWSVRRRSLPSFSQRFIRLSYSENFLSSTVESSQCTTRIYGRTVDSSTLCVEPGATEEIWYAWNEMHTSVVVSSRQTFSRIQSPGPRTKLDRQTPWDTCYP